MIYFEASLVSIANSSVIVIPFLGDVESAAWFKPKDFLGVVVIEDFDEPDEITSFLFIKKILKIIIYLMELMEQNEMLIYFLSNFQTIIYHP